jgi:hypothetical protein
MVCSLCWTEVADDAEFCTGCHQPRRAGKWEWSDPLTPAEEARATRDDLAAIASGAVGWLRRQVRV